MKKLFVPFLIALATVWTLGLSACNTVEGIGEDVQSAGQAVEGTADAARPR